MHRKYAQSVLPLSDPQAKSRRTKQLTRVIAFLILPTEFQKATSLSVQSATEEFLAYGIII